MEVLFLNFKVEFKCEIEKSDENKDNVDFFCLQVFVYLDLNDGEKIFLYFCDLDLCEKRMN